MKPVPANSLAGDSAKARVCMFYGESGVGKSINSIPKKEDIDTGEKVLYVQVEGNNPMPELVGLGYDVSHIDVIQFAGTTWREWREFTNNAKDIANKYRYMVIDSFTQLMELCFNEVVEETKNKRAVDKNGKPTKFSLGDEVKAEQADYGAIGGLMIRFFNSLDVYKALGVHIIFTAKLAMNDKYVEHPMLVGKYFADKLPYYLDILGRVKAQPLNKETGEYQIPKVAFYSKDNTFTAKMRCADAKKSFKIYPFNVVKIINASFEPADKISNNNADSEQN